MLPDPKARRAPLRLETLGAALDQKLQNEAEILDVLVTAAQRGQDQTELWARLDAAAVRDDRLAELAFAYERLSRDKKLAKLPPAAQADILTRIGVFFADSFGDADGAEVYLQQAIGLAPAHPVAFAKLETLLIRKQEGVRLCDLYAAAALHKTDRKDQIAMLRRALEIIEGFGIDDEERQIKLFSQISKLDPSDARARKSLEDAFLRAGKIAELVKMLEQSLHGDVTAEGARSTRERLIDLYVERLREPEKTIAHVEEVLRTSPDSGPARKAAEALLAHKVLAPRAASALAAAYEKQGRYADAAKCLAIEVDHFRGPRRVEAQKKLAGLRFQRLGDLPGALSLYEQVVVLDPSDDEVRERYRSLSQALDKSLDATRVLTRALAGAKDAALRAKIGVELGEIFLELGDAKKAKVAFQQVMESGGAEPELLRATRSLAKLASEAHDAKALASALGKLASSAPDPEERARSAVELGKLCETDLSDMAGAIDAWRKALGTSHDRDALLALSRLYEATGASRDLAQVLDRRADTESDVEVRRQVLLASAELRASKLHDRGGAIESLRRAASLGAGRSATQKLLPLLEQERRWEDLASALETDASLAPIEERAALRSKLGQLRLARLADTAGAIRAFGAALAADRFEKTARLSLEKILGGPAADTTPAAKGAASAEDRLAAAKLLEDVYRAEGATQAIVRVLDTKASLLATAEERLGALEEAAEVCERDAGDAKRALEIAARGLREAVDNATGEVPSFLARVERLGEKVADKQRRADALASALGEREVSHPALFELAKKAGDALVASGDVARALPILRRALAFEPRSPDLIHRIDTLLREQGSPEERVALYRTLLQKSPDLARQRELLHGIAAIQRRDLDDATGAIDTYRRILELEPEDHAAQEALLEAYAEAGQADALYKELGARLFRADGEERGRLLVRLADVAADAGWAQRAAEHYQEALHAGAALGEERLAAVESLGLSLGDARLVRLVLTRRVDQAASSEEEAQWLERLGQHDADVLHDRMAGAASFLRAARLVEESAGEEERARKLYERVLALAPEERFAAERLVELYERSTSLWSSLPSVHDVLIRTAPTQEDAVKALLAFEPAAVKARASGAFSSAVATVGKRHGPLSSDLWKQVQAALARVLASDVERQDEAAAVFRAMVESAPAESKREREAFEAFLDAAPDTPARRADKRWLFELRARSAPEGSARAAALYAWACDEERTGDSAMALSLLGRALVAEPGYDEALAAQCRIMLSVGDFAGAAEAIKARRDRAEGDARTALERELMRLQFDRLGRAADALDAAARILETIPTDAAALDLAERAMCTEGMAARGADVLARASEADLPTDATAAILRRIVGSPAFRSEELRDHRASWVLRLLDCLAERPDEALEIALTGVAASPLEWTLWERAERLSRELSRPEAVAAAYRTALEGDGAVPSDLEAFEELGRRAVDFHEEWFDEPERVAGLLKRMVERAPAPGWAFERLKLVYNAGEQWNDLFTLYDAALAATMDREQRLSLLEDAASTARDLAGDPERLIAYLEQILALRHDARTRTALERLYERHGRKARLIELLAAQLGELDPDAATATRARIARLQLDVGDPDAAFDTVEGLLAAEPNRPDAFELLEQILRSASPSSGPLGSEDLLSARRRAAALLEKRYRAEDRPRDLLRVLEIELSSASSPSARIPRLREILHLRLTTLGDEAGALDDVAALLVLEPGDDGHKDMLVRLAERVGRHDRLAATLAEAAERTSDPKRKVQLYSEAAAIHEGKLGDLEGAITLQRAILPLAESDPAALLLASSELARLLSRTGRKDELCDALERVAKIAEDVAVQRRALTEVARIAEIELGDVDRAVRAHEARLVLDPQDSGAQDSLVALLTASNRPDALCRALVRRADATKGDPARADLMQAARIAEETLGDVDLAIGLYERIRRDHGRDVETGDALIRVYERAEDWDALARALEAEASAETAPSRSGELLCKLGDLHAQRTGKLSDAIASYSLACDQGSEGAARGLSALVSRLRPDSPDERAPYVDAVRALAHVHTDRGDWQALVSLTDARLTAASSPPERVAILREAAKLWEQHGKSLGAAFDATLAAFEIAPDAELASEVRRLVALAARHAVLRDRLPAIVERWKDHPISPVRDLFWDLARYFRDAAGDADAEEDALRRALAADPSNVLLCSELCDLLRRRSAPSRALVDALLMLSGLIEPLAPLREAAERAAELGDVALTKDVALRLLSAALDGLREAASGPALEAATWAYQALIRIARDAGDRETVVTLGEAAARLPLAPKVRRAFRLAAADHALTEQAITIYRELFDQDPRDQEVASRLFDLCNERGDRDALIEIRARQIDASEGAQERTTLRLDLAQRLTEAERVDAAIEVLRTGLTESPGHEATVSALGDALKAQGRVPELATLWEQEAARREPLGAPLAAAALWMRAATVAENNLNDVVRAIRAYRRAAALDSKDALAALARLYTAAGQHAEAARVIETLAGLASPAEKPTALLALADALVAAGEPEQARQRLEGAVRQFQDAAPLRARLRDLYRAAGELAPLAGMMAEDAERTSDPAAKLTLLREAAEIHLAHSDPGRAVPLLSSALTLASDDLGLRLLWCRALSESGRRDDALTSLRALIDGYGGRRPKERALVHHEIARVLLAGGERSRAMSELDAALRIDPAHPEILQALARLALGEGQLERAHRTFRALLLVARRPPTAAESAAGTGMSRAEILCELADIARRQGDEPRASEYMESAFDAGREAPAEGQRLVRALAARSRPHDLARALLAETERAQGADAARLWSDLAALYEGPLDRLKDAVLARLRALALVPDSATKHEQALAACQRAGEVPLYVSAVTDLVTRSEAAGGSDRSIDLLIRLGRALEAAPDPAGASEAYLRAESLLDHRPLDSRLPEIWKALERCFAGDPDPEKIARVLDKRIRVASDAERVEALYALADLRLRSEATYDLGLDLLVEATGHDTNENRAEAALRHAANAKMRSARAPRMLERFAREKSRPRALLDALLLVFETEPLGEDGMREAVGLAHDLGDPSLAQDLLKRAVERDEAGEPLDPGLRVWARTTLADVREEAGELAQACALREAAARHADPAEERALLLRVARDAAGPLADLPHAARIYEELRLREPADREVWEPLADVYRRLGDGAKLGTLIEDTAPLIESPVERGKLRLERARLALGEDETRAIDLLHEVLEDDPAQAEAAKLLASALERQGRVDDLVDLLRRQIDTAKDREDPRGVTELSMKLGALLERRGDEQGALDVYHRALDWDGQSREALRAVLRLSIKLDNSVDLGDALEKLLEVEEGDEAARLAIELSGLKSAHGDAPGAERALEEGFAKSPANDQLLSMLTERYTASGSHKKIANAFTVRSRALTTITERIDALCRAAEVLREKVSDPRGAADVLQEALSLDPRERDVLLALIDACEALGEPARAIAAVTASISALPEDPWLYRSRAALHAAAGRDDLALIDLSRAQDKSGGGYTGEYLAALESAIDRAQRKVPLPEDRPERELRILLAEIAAKTGDLERARTQLSDLLRRDGKDKGALRALAQLEDGAGNWDAASAVYRRLLSLEEGEALVDAALRLADACERADRLGDARGGLERALRAAPANGAVRDRLRRLYEATSAKAELAILITEDARNEPDPMQRAHVFMRAARLLTEAGDGVRALAVLEEAQRILPDHPDLPIAHASALAAAGRAPEARAMLTQAAALHRGKRSKQLGAIHLALSRIEQQAGNSAEALAAMLRAFDNDPQNAELAMDLGAFALELDDAETAGRAFRAVTLLRTAPLGAEGGAPPTMKALAYHRLAMIANAQGDRRKARFMVDKALAEDPGLAEARALLDTLR